MDLKLVPHAEPTAHERAALDHVLGPATSGWDGGARADGVEGNTAAGGHAARARRHLLLPALWALQERVGWISPGGLNELCRRLTVPPADAYGVATFYALFALEPRPARVVHVCEDVACKCNGSDELIAQVEERFGPEGRLSDDGSATWYRSPCLGQCDRAPAALVAVAGDEPLDRAQAPTTASSVLALLGGGEPGPAPAVSDPPGGRAVAAAPSPRGRRRSIEPRGLPCARRLRRAATRARARAGGGTPRGEGLEARRPRRSRVPDRSQVGGRRATARAAALPRVQRRRVRARDVQGPRADGGRPVRGARVDDDRRVRDRMRARVCLPPRRVSTGAARARARRCRGPLARVPRRGRDGPRVRVRRRAAARRGRLHLRRGDGDLRVHRGQAWRAPREAAVPGRGRPLRRPDRRQQRRDARQRARRRPRLRPLVRGAGDGGLDRDEAPLRLRSRRAARDVRGRVRRDAA